MQITFLLFDKSIKIYKEILLRDLFTYDKFKESNTVK